MATIEELESLRWDLRRDCVDIIMAGAGGHIGGDMSVIDALMTLYANHLNISPETVDDPNRDRFVLSKGHAMEAYYAVPSRAETAANDSQSGEICHSSCHAVSGNISVSPSFLTEGSQSYRF